RHYGGYAQIENGVGMTRMLLDGWKQARNSLPSAVRAPRKVALVTGTMALPVIERLARDLERVAGLDVRVIPVANAFFGPLVTVAGLLCGQDVLDVLHERCDDFSPDDLILLPRVALDSAGRRFLDDVTVEDFRTQVSAEVAFAKTADELAAAVCTLAEREPALAGGA